MYLHKMAFVYSCCFWFSLRLGGLMISFFSILQAVLFLILFSIFSVQDYEDKRNILKPLNDINLIYMKSFITSFLEESNYDDYIKVIISLYIITCLLYIYGALKLINILMFPYIFLELLRLVGLSFVGITGLLVLKENTMDIGLLIGMSVLVGFNLLGMFYLWICATNLPIVINEIKADEQVALLNKLENVVGKQKVRSNLLFSEQRHIGVGQILLQRNQQNSVHHYNRFLTSHQPPRYYY